jgi:arginyl-tRNA synthetase
MCIFGNLARLVYNNAMITTELANAIKRAVKQKYGLEIERPEVVTAAAGFGDFATNVAFKLAAELKRAPREIATELAGLIENPGVERAEAAGAGFVNFWLTNGYWYGQLAAIDADYAKSESGRGQKVQIEFISANPTGPLTIGNARGGFIGDVLARVMERSGYDVTREYYFNDAGTQINKLLESVKMEAGVTPATDERQYNGEYIVALAAKFSEQLRTLSDAELKPLLTGEIIASYIKPAVRKMGIEFDVWFDETQLIKDGTFERVLGRLRELGLIFERDGATWLKTAELGDERGERVIIKSNGDPTYMAPDIAYHANIFGQRGFDAAIKVLGPDHIAQFPSVYAAVHALYPDKDLRMASYQWLRVVRDGKEVKVSKRLGQFVTIADLIDQVGMPVARFLTLMRSADSHMDFDLDLAAEQSAKNPYYYVMYAYARANSILEKAAGKGLQPAAGEFKLSAAELALTREMAMLPGILAEMAADYGVHRLTFYGLELAKLFTDYYESMRIIDLPEAEAAHKLFAVSQFVRLMDVYWRLMGIEPIRHMSSETK